MPLEQPDLQHLIERIRGGDEDAARELLEQFEPHVRRVVRRRLPRIMRSKFDSMDFVQSVWGEFFPRLARHEIEFDNPRQLAQYLTLVARAKVIAEYRRRFGKKHDLFKELAIGITAHTVPLQGNDPTPSQEAIAHERLETILGGRPELHRTVLQLRSQGFTYVEVAAKLGIDERTARRIVHDVEEDLRLRDAGK